MKKLLYTILQLASVAILQASLIPVVAQTRMIAVDTNGIVLAPANVYFATGSLLATNPTFYGNSIIESSTINDLNSTNITLAAGGHISGVGDYFTLTIPTGALFDGTIITNNADIRDNSNHVYTVTSRMSDTNGNGTAKQVWSSRGTGSSPQWENRGSQTLEGGANTGTLSNGQNYYIGWLTHATWSSQTTAGRYRLRCLQTGTITSWGYEVYSSTPGTSEDVVMGISVNGAADVATITEQWDATNIGVSTNCSIAITAGQYIQFHFIAPSWVTPATSGIHAWAILEY